VPTREMSYGEQLRRLRVSVEPPMSQKALAEQLGVHVSTISRWEANETMPALDQARPLARALHVPVELVLPPETK
jgi:transcriptional regulator with XRE-family HTH domain